MDMGKAIILKKKDGEKVYPISASDLIFDPKTKRTVKDDLAEKIGDAPSDGKQYVRKNGAWGEVDIPESGSKEFVNITLLTNKSDHSALNGTNIKVQYSDITKNYTYNGSQLTIEIPSGLEYTITPDKVSGYVSPSDVTYISVGGNSRDLRLIYFKASITTIRINQNISDPASMITRIVNEGGIEEIRANSHRYTGIFEDGVMKLRQLDDNDGTKYTDGTNANLTTVGNDVWMKLPQFYWKCEQHDTNVWDFTVVYGAKIDDSYKTWDGKDLIGVYEAYRNSDLLYSISGIRSSVSSSQENAKSCARARGEGFSLVKWKHHCMMAMLYFCQYNNTDSQKIVGIGKQSYTENVGSSNLLGMTDTVRSNGTYDSMNINFWGLEAWWGNIGEFIDNVEITKSIMKITEDDGTIRQLDANMISGDWTSKLLFGENIDLIPTEKAASSTTGFCDQNINIKDNDYIYVLVRGGAGAGTGCGISMLENKATSNYSTADSSRIAYRGEYIII